MKKLTPCVNSKQTSQLWKYPLLHWRNRLQQSRPKAHCKAGKHLQSKSFQSMSSSLSFKNRAKWSNWLTKMILFKPRRSLKLIKTHLNEIARWLRLLWIPSPLWSKTRPEPALSEAHSSTEPLKKATSWMHLKRLSKPICKIKTNKRQKSNSHSIWHPSKTRVQ